MRSPILPTIVPCLAVVLLGGCSQDPPEAVAVPGERPHSEFAVSINPDGPKLIAVPANSSGNDKDFWVKNVSTSSGTSSLGCAATGVITCTGLSHASVSLAPGESTMVNAVFSAGAVNSYPYDTLKVTSPYGGPGKVRVMVE